MMLNAYNNVHKNIPRVPVLSQLIQRSPHTHYLSLFSIFIMCFFVLIVKSPVLSVPTGTLYITLSFRKTLDQFILLDFITTVINGE